MTKMRRSIQMRCMNILHFALTTGIMIAAWLVWCAPLLVPQYAQTVLMAICGCWSGILLIVCCSILIDFSPLLIFQCCSGYGFVLIRRSGQICPLRKSIFSPVR